MTSLSSYNKDISNYPNLKESHDVKYYFIDLLLIIISGFYEDWDIPVMDVQD